MAERTRGRIARWLIAIPNSIWVLIGLGVILAVSALFGGLSDAETTDDALPTIAVGEEIETPEFTIVVSSARLADVAPDYSFEAADGMTYLIVDAVMTNEARVTTISFRDLLQLDWLEEPTSTRVARLIDGSAGAQANPGVPTGIAFIWEVPADGVSPGDTIEVTVSAKSFMEDGDVTYGSYWYDPVPVAIVEVEVGS